MDFQDLGSFYVTRLTADAIGKPGKRVFYIQAEYDGQVSTLMLEKAQLNTLVAGIEQLITGIAERFPELHPPVASFDPAWMRINPPVDPLYRVGEIGLSFDPVSDTIGLILKEIIFGEPETPNEPLRSITFLCSRTQILQFSRWSLDVLKQGRQICPQCGEPMDPAGHFCPKKNGHKKG